MVFNTLNKTFSLQNLCAEFCCFSLRWSAVSCHTLQWSWWPAARVAGEEACFPSPSKAAGEMPVPSCQVHCQAQEQWEARCAHHPARLWALCSATLGLQHGVGPRLPALAARICSSSGVTSTQNVLRPCSAPISCWGVAAPSS